MNNTDIRWVQRFNNYRNALAKLKEAISDERLAIYSDLEREGMIQRFEYTYELAWKTLQDLHEHKGYLDIKGPNPTLEQALKDGYITDEKGWRKMKKSRELTSHTYDSDTAQAIAKDIVTVFLGLLLALEEKLLIEWMKSKQV